MSDVPSKGKQMLYFQDHREAAQTHREVVFDGPVTAVLALAAVNGRLK